MLNIAVIEDDPEARSSLVSILKQYAGEYSETFHIFEFDDAVNFLDHYTEKYQIVFMDIDLPYVNGLNAAKRLRELDSVTVLIFITNMAQYAVKGYEVNALDYIIKPVNYSSFALKMKRAVQQAHLLTADPCVITTKSGLRKISRHDIRYVEVSGHQIIYHTDQGEFQTYGTMKQVIKEIDDSSFALCNSCYLVNMYYVTAIENFTVRLGETELQISHPRKKNFLKALNDYIGGNSV